MKRFVLLIALALVLTFPCVSSADVNADLRVKLGSAAGMQDIEIDDISTDLDENGGGNVQLEVALSPAWHSPVGFVMGIGIFHRKHSGKDTDPTSPTTVDYEVTGISIAPGVRIRTSDRFQFEGRLEIGYGPEGEATFSTPGFAWNDTKEGSYASATLIAGWYYLFAKPGMQLGFELGLQSFVGEFQIWNSAGYWADGNVSGTTGTANVVLGLRF